MKQGELTRKIDVLDIIIEVLKEHEKNLDESIGRLENLLSKRHTL